MFQTHYDVSSFIIIKLIVLFIYFHKICIKQKIFKMEVEMKVSQFYMAQLTV